MALITGLISTGTAVLGTFGFTAASSFAAAAYGALSYAALGYATNALLGPKTTPSGANRGYRVTARGTALDAQIIYGSAATGGVLVYRNLSDSNSSVLFDVIALAAHECDAISDVYVNGYKVLNYLTAKNGSIDASLTEGWVGEVEDADGTNVGQIFKNSGNALLHVSKLLGTEDQQAPSNIVSEVTEWTTAHQLRGVCAAVVRYTYSANVFPNGIPSLQFVVRGKKVYDPRTGNTQWSSNPALCIRDYILADYGLNEPTTRIDDYLVRTSAVYCEKTAADGARWFTCNGSFTTAAQPHDILSDLLTSMGGLLWYAQGQWRMKPAVITNLQAIFTEDDFRSSITLVTKHSRRDNFNVVRGKYQGAETNYQPTEYAQVDQILAAGDALSLDDCGVDELYSVVTIGNTDWNVVGGSIGVDYSVDPLVRITGAGKALQAGTTGTAQRALGRYVVQDALEELPIDFDLPFTDTEAEARRIANVFLERNRQQLTFKCKFGMSAFAVQVGDIVSLTRARYGWTAKRFEVSWWSFGMEPDGDLQVELTLREIDASVFDESQDGPVWDQATYDAISTA
jgi:hypothetical protein